MNNLYSGMTADMSEFSRNMGFLSYEEQQKINDSTVSIAGAGGDGGLLAIELARFGVGSIRLADPETFDIENINRQAASNTESMHKNKALTVAKYIQTINSKIEVEVYEEGINENNIEQFTGGSDLIVDETEFTMPELGVMIARSARRIGKPVLMALNIGFGAQVTSYHPEGKSFESLMGLSEGADLEEIATADVPLSRWIARLPSYVDLDVFAAVAKGEMKAPSVVQGVGLAASMAATEALKHLAPSKQRGEPVWAPRVYVVDAHDRYSKVIRFPRFSHYRSLAHVIANNKFGKTPKANYSLENS
jgi:molybdopterin/thiamine biosynthesis adenylyltransferase